MTKRFDWMAVEGQVRAMVADCKSTREIADALGTSPHLVSATLARWKLCIDPAGAKERRRATVRAIAQNNAIREKRAATIRDLYRNDPAKRKVQAKNTRKLWRKPGHREAIAAATKAYAATPEGKANRLKGGATCKIKHIPSEYRDDYRRLARRGDYTAAEAEAAIRDQVAADIRRRAKAAKPVSKPLTFAQKLEAVRAGTATVYVMPTCAPSLDGRHA